MLEKAFDSEQIEGAIKLIEDIIYSTQCPDPGEGGCIGGPVPGYGCLHEAAVSTRYYLEKGRVTDAIKLLELMKSKIDGRIELTAALNLLRQNFAQEVGV